MESEEHTNESDTHFEYLVEELLLEHGPMSPSEISSMLGEQKKMFVVIDPQSVEKYERLKDGEMEEITLVRGGAHRAISPAGVDGRLSRAWGTKTKGAPSFYRDDSGRWHLGND